MDFNFKMFNWNNSGAEPSDNLKTNGFKQGYKPAAGVFNKFWYLVTKAITELQEKLKGHAENKENPHSVTAAQVGLDKVNNTPDSEKSVKFASEAGVGRKVEHGLEIHFNGGRTEGTDLWTYDGSTSRSVNITPKKIKAAEEVHTHETTDINGLRDKIDKIVTATSTDGVTYTATADGITELYNGLEITIIPNTVSTARNITLNLNGLGAVPIRRPLSFSTFVATSIDADRLYFLSANTPCRLMYHANYTSGGIWLMADKVKTSAQDLYGTVPVESGGTGKTTSPYIYTHHIDATFESNTSRVNGFVQFSFMNTSSSSYNCSDDEQFWGGYVPTNIIMPAVGKITQDQDVIIITGIKTDGDDLYFYGYNIDLGEYENGNAALAVGQGRYANDHFTVVDTVKGVQLF